MGGTGASPQRPVMARVAAARLGWDVDVDAWGGTGFTTTGRSPGYLERLRRPGALAGEYDVVLLEGGTNDAAVGSDPVAVRAAVRQVVAEVPAAPAAGADRADGRVRPARRRRPAPRRRRRRGARRRGELGLPFFSPWSQQWTRDQQPDRFLHPDALHPNTYGYGVLGLRLADELAAALPDLGSSSQRPQATSSAP
jgi:lysophospholipase L1-like esterase